MRFRSPLWAERMGRAFAMSIFFAAFSGCPALADVTSDVVRVFELSEKLRPGMNVEALNGLLGQPAEEYRMSGKASGTVRYQWLHGPMGVIAYDVEGSAYRIDIILPCHSASNATQALGAFTREGKARYAAMPRFDQKKSQYYWTRDGVRFAFSKYNSTTVQSSCTLAR